MASTEDYNYIIKNNCNNNRLKYFWDKRNALIFLYWESYDPTRNGMFTFFFLMWEKKLYIWHRVNTGARKYKFVDSKPLFLLLSFYLLVCFIFVWSLLAMSFWSLTWVFYRGLELLFWMSQWKKFFHYCNSIAVLSKSVRKCFTIITERKIIKFTNDLIKVHIHKIQY